MVTGPFKPDPTFRQRHAPLLTDLQNCTTFQRSQIGFSWFYSMHHGISCLLHCAPLLWSLRKQAALVDIDNLFVRNQSGISLGARAQGIVTSAVWQALAEMQYNLETRLSLSQISAIVVCSPKKLSRRFQAELGLSPGCVYRHLRLTHAHQLLENTRLSISDISLRTGYNCSAALSRAFKARFGRAPRQLRQ